MNHLAEAKRRARLAHNEKVRKRKEKLDPNKSEVQGCVRFLKKINQQTMKQNSNQNSYRNSPYQLNSSTDRINEQHKISNIS